MPRIDDKSFQKKAFKKTEYRSWDDNLLEKLSHPSPKKETEELAPKAKNFSIKTSKKANPPIKTENTSNKSNDTSNCVQIVLNKSSDSVQLAPNKSSDSVQFVSDKSPDCVQKEFNKSSESVQTNTNNSVQFVFKSDRLEIKKLIERLGGNERKIFDFIINVCSINGSTFTGEISGKELMRKVDTTKNGRETALRRLREKGLVQREEGKRGFNGTINIHVTELIKIEALNYMNSHLSKKELFESSAQLMLNYSSDSVQLNTNNSVQLPFNSSLYSSSNINTTTNLREEWKNINYDPLAHIGFSENHLKQLIGKNTPEIVQDSINHFSYGLEYNQKTQEYSKEGKNPLNILIGVLRKGQAWVETNYRSPQEIAQEKFLERKREERGRLSKLEEEAYSLALEDWKKSLTKEEINTIAPCGKDPLAKKKQELELSTHFREKKWQSLKKDYLFFD